mgnify:CR=1 FL=1
MNEKEKMMYADFIMAMRLRGKEEYNDNNVIVAENQAAGHLYGEKYRAIRSDFNERIKRNL